MTSEYIRVSEEYRMANGRAARTTSAATAVRRARIGSRWPSASGRPPMRWPAQNASGNWVKVVQRVPVRLRLLQPDKGPLLRSGLSAEVSIELQEDDPAQSSVTSGKPIALLQ